MVICMQSVNKKDPMSISDEAVSCTCVMFSRESFIFIGFIFISHVLSTAPKHPERFAFYYKKDLSVIITRMCRKGTKDLCSAENGPKSLLEVRKTTLILYFFADLHNHPKTLE